MRLNVEYNLPRLRCPACGVGLDIEATYEDRRTDCNGRVTCPECEAELDVHSEFKFVIKEVDK